MASSEPVAVMGPPVFLASAVMAASGSGSCSPPEWTAEPSAHSTSAASTPIILAARPRRSSTTCRHASTTAMPVAKVARLPSVMSVNPTDSVSPTTGVMS